ncbi:26S proteasome regulatory subunit RPN13 isoform X2 [Amborella trichopoda]|uniref:26S proteasome regulatory subunit RPN13 isoform X2 n=1 Tax=Amborella trichopoda TaxID=13333 RepID=UPI0009BE6F41|nr:26S proteasome regulatory subunit RPN13 isoform X2 [Amborella trichopoda]|eukprot:XP_020527011.1 26S proteasome regulatory subunit RPN13 isoform X2 [Amborella trichopoda]
MKANEEYDIDYKYEIVDDCCTRFIHSFLFSITRFNIMGSSAAEPLPVMPEVLLVFRAGKMFMEGTRVVPDARKGLVRIARGEEGLVHFQWIDRTQNSLEDDQIVFPDEAIFEKVPQASGRVYILKFNTDNRKFFFWMQEPSSDADAGLCNSVNYYINRPIEEPESSAPLDNSAMSEDIGGNEVSSSATNLDSSALVAQSAGNMNPPSGTVRLADLQRILSSIGSTDAEAAQDIGFGLGDILKPDLILPVVETLPLEERLESFLPEGRWTPDALMELFQSPPFRQQVESFNYRCRFLEQGRLICPSLELTLANINSPCFPFLMPWMILLPKRRNPGVNLGKMRAKIANLKGVVPMIQWMKVNSIELISHKHS